MGWTRLGCNLKIRTYRAARRNESRRAFEGASINEASQATNNCSMKISGAHIRFPVYMNATACIHTDKIIFTTCVIEEFHNLFTVHFYITGYSLDTIKADSAAWQGNKQSKIGILLVLQGTGIQRFESISCTHVATVA
jgi:hypothetical protein